MLQVPGTLHFPPDLNRINARTGSTGALFKVPDNSVPNNPPASGYDDSMNMWYVRVYLHHQTDLQRIQWLQSGGRGMQVTLAKEDNERYFKLLDSPVTQPVAQPTVQQVGQFTPQPVQQFAPQQQASYTTQAPTVPVPAPQSYQSPASAGSTRPVVSMPVPYSERMLDKYGKLSLAYKLAGEMTDDPAARVSLAQTLFINLEKQQTPFDSTIVDRHVAIRSLDLAAIDKPNMVLMNTIILLDECEVFDDISHVVSVLKKIGVTGEDVDVNISNTWVRVAQIAWAYSSLIFLGLDEDNALAVLAAANRPAFDKGVADEAPGPEDIML